RGAWGQCELEEREQVLSLLVSMSRKKLADYARRQAAACRDYRRTTPGERGKRQPAAADVDPGRQVATKELVEEFRKRLSPEERELAELRALGRDWGEIAAGRGESSEALRKKLSRAVSRISLDLGLTEDGDE